MSAAVVIYKRLTGERWELGADLDNRDLLIGFALGRGYAIEEEADLSAGPPPALPAATPAMIMKGEHQMKAREVIKAALAGEPIDQSTLMRAAQSRANKSYPDDSEPVAFRKFCAAHPEVLQVLKTAPPAAAKQQPATSFGILAEQALQECLKRGLPWLPEGSPYAAYFEKSAVGDGTGSRDAVDPNYETQEQRAINSIADGLVGNGPGRFQDRATAIRFMRSSPKFSALFSGSGSRKYREAIAGMLRDHLP